MSLMKQALYPQATTAGPKIALFLFNLHRAVFACMFLIIHGKLFPILDDQYCNPEQGFKPRT